MKTSLYKFLGQDEKKALLKKTGFISEEGYVITSGCGLEVIRRHLEKEWKTHVEKETRFKMKNVKDSSRLVCQLERIRMGGRDLTKDLSEECRRKLVTKLMNSKLDANNLLLESKKEIDLYTCKDDIDDEEKKEFKSVVEDIVLLREI